MIFDIALLIFLGIGFYQGYKNGIIYSVFSLLGWFLGIVAALKFSSLMANFLKGVISAEPRTVAILSFVLMFILVLLLMKLIAWGLEQILKTFSLNLPNQIAGGLLHGCIGLFVFCIFIWFLNRLDALPENWKKDSKTYTYVEDLAPRLIKGAGAVLPVAKETFDQFDELFDTQLTPQHPKEE